jgi:hypothetical protein
LTRDHELVFNLELISRLAGLSAGTTSNNEVAMALVKSAFAGAAAIFDTPELWSLSRNLAHHMDKGELLSAALLECAICHTHELVGPETGGAWRSYAKGAQVLDVCPKHFAPDGAPEAEAMKCYSKVMKALGITWDPEVGF